MVDETVDGRVESAERNGRNWRPPSSLVAIGWNGAAQVVPQIISFAIAPFLVHNLGIDRFGIWALLLTVVVILATLDGGVGVSLTRFFALQHTEDDRGQPVGSCSAEWRSSSS